MSWWKIGRDGRTDRLEQIESFSLSVVGINMHVQRFTSFTTGDCRVIPQRSSVVSLFSSPVSCYSAVDAQITCRECLIHFLTSLKINQRKQWHSKARKQRADPSPSHSFGCTLEDNDSEVHISIRPKQSKEPLNCETQPSRWSVCLLREELCWENELHRYSC